MNTILCAAVVLNCATVQLDTSPGIYFEDGDLQHLIKAQIRCEYHCPKKCLTKFIKRDNNMFWAVCGQEEIQDDG